MINTIPVHQALVRFAAKRKGGMWMAMAAAFTAMTPAHRYDSKAFAAWAGLSAQAADKVRRLMREAGWLDADDRLSGMPADILLGTGYDDQADDLFIDLCAKISAMRGIRYHPTPSRRALFMDRAKEHGAQTVHRVALWKAKQFMRTTMSDGRSMAKYARIETLCNKSNFEKYHDQYIDNHD